MVLAALLIWRYRDKSAEGIELQSTKVHPLPEAVYYLQKDEKWASDPLGGVEGAIRQEPSIRTQATGRK